MAMTIEQQADNVRANTAHLIEAMMEAAKWCDDTSPHELVIRKAREQKHCKTIWRALFSDPDTFRTYYAGMVAEVLAGRDKMAELRRRLRRFGMEG